MGTTTTTPDQQARTDALLDRGEIEVLVHRLGAALDDGDFEALRTILTPDATVTTPGGHAEGIDALIAQASRNHVPAATIQHLITGVLVDLDGDRAAVRTNLVVTFADQPGDPTPTRRLGERYAFGARRTDDGWRLTSVATTIAWREVPV